MAAAALRLTGQTAAAAPQGGPGGGQRSRNNFMGASVTPDGRYIYAGARTGAAGYNQMMGIDAGRRCTTAQTGRLERRTLQPRHRLPSGREPRRQVARVRLASHGGDGTQAARASSRATRSGSRTDIQRDDIESRGSRDLLPGYSWTPDSKALVLAHARQDLASRRDDGPAECRIPFTAEVDQMLAELVRFEYPVNDSTLTVRQIRGAHPSPNGKRLVFSALDRLWTMDLPSGTPKRLTTSDEGEHSPVWSPGRPVSSRTSAGRRRAVTFWRVPGRRRQAGEADEAVGVLRRRSRTRRTVTRIVAVRAPREQRAIVNDEINPKLIITDLVWIPAAGGEAKFIAPLTNAERPHFSADSTRVWVYDDEDGLVSMRWDGTDRKAHLDRDGLPAAGRRAATRGRERATELQVSPDGDRVLARGGQQDFRGAAAGDRRTDADGVGRAAEQQRHPVPATLPHWRRLPRLECRRRRVCTTRWDGRSSSTISRARTRSPRTPRPGRRRVRRRPDSAQPPTHRAASRCTSRRVQTSRSRYRRIVRAARSSCAARASSR